MDKYEILRKAQQEQRDERAVELEMRAYMIGWISVSVLIMLLIVSKIFTGEQAYELIMLFWAQQASVSLFQYAKQREQKRFLVIGVFSVLLALGNLFLLLRYYGVFG